MKNFLKIIIVGFLILSFSSCESFLEEENLSGKDSNNFFVDQKSFEQTINGAYLALRAAYQNYAIEQLGTDIFQYGSFSINSYYNMSASTGEIRIAWQSYYNVIQICNTVISRADDIDMPKEVKNVGVAEVKTLRALMYFKLVQLFGDVPLILNEVKTDKVDYVREKESVVYEQIIRDLADANKFLPLTQPEFGKVTKGMAQHLLAKVYLTRGYRDFGLANDFSIAATYADSVIESGQYQLLDTYAEVFDPENQVNDEIIFSIQYADQQTANYVDKDRTGNNKHQIGKFSLDGKDGYAREASYYARPAGLIGQTVHLFNLYNENDAEDTRNEVSYHYTLYAIVDGNKVKKGDIIYLFPKTPWTDDQKASVPYEVVNSDEYGDFLYPMLKKFDDFTPYGDGEGTRDTYVFRLAETYLIGAEAYLNANNPSKALDYINKVRIRAANSSGDKLAMEIGQGELDIDFILDEFARELAGETERWFELKRTGKLMERANAYNEGVQEYNAMKEYHLVRPIPQSEVELSGNSITQNPGYIF